MARRAKTSFKPMHLIGILVFLALIGFGGWAFMHRSSEGAVTGGAEFSLREYLDNSNALGGNTYHFEGVISERLDNWPTSDGRCFNVLLDEGGESQPVAVIVPPKFRNLNIQRGQRFKFQVRVRSENGALEATALSKA